MRPLALTSVLALTSMIPSASAQVRNGAAFATPLSNPQTITPGFATFGIPRPTSFPLRPRQHPFGNAPVFFYSDIPYESVTPPSVSVIVVQPSLPAPQVQEQHASAKPLLLELQGEHWVRVDQFHPVSAAHPATPGRGSPRSSAKHPAATLLMFRNGRVEETSSYAIIGDILYAHSDYWTTGAWTKKIALAELDLAATIHANEERGVSFKLPAGPNQVVLQP